MLIRTTLPRTASAVIAAGNAVVSTAIAVQAWRDELMVLAAIFMLAATFGLAAVLSWVFGR